MNNGGKKVIDLSSDVLVLQRGEPIMGTLGSRTGVHLGGGTRWAQGGFALFFAMYILSP